MKVKTQIEQFFEYCVEWYGKGGIYDHGATDHQIAHCIMRHIHNPDRTSEFQGDTIDREQVREWLSSVYGLKELKGGAAQ